MSDIPQSVQSVSGAAVRQADLSSITTEDLLRGERSIHILHDGSTYILRITGNNKLILTK